MKPDELQQYLQDHIPLSRAMAVSVTSANVDEVMLSAPLAPNINHRDTIFGGSASAVAILAAWSLLLLRIRNEDISARLVIQRNTMEYLEPIDEAFSVRSFLQTPERWSHFTRMLARRGKARVTVDAELMHRNKTVGRLSGEFVALSSETGKSA